MRMISPRNFTASRAWGAMDIERITGATTVRLHWTDQPYKWHINDGPEVFVVLDGTVDMHARENGTVTIHRLLSGDIFHAEEGGEHVAHPCGIARVLVIEREGSV
ncbi:MAG: cupin [Paracoccus sp. (in: a-proteobacteria)]|uniref:cupin n=1 Tax=Paracoccus sp. TaxID=267 RepID=UPI0026DF2F14|nr:cupin [Paracoccus sp. (in: a-proteobacteria)]MDO5630681.1 cupin [Paracoccus sp. (in: a-proteobacteria)]